MKEKNGGRRDKRSETQTSAQHQQALGRWLQAIFVLPLCSSRYSLCSTSAEPIQVSMRGAGRAEPATQYQSGRTAVKHCERRLRVVDLHDKWSGISVASCAISYQLGVVGCCCCWRWC